MLLTGAHPVVLLPVYMYCYSFMGLVKCICNSLIDKYEVVEPKPLRK